MHYTHIPLLNPEGITNSAPPLGTTIPQNEDRDYQVQQKSSGAKDRNERKARIPINCFPKHSGNCAVTAYTTNAMEALPRQLRKVMENSSMFPNDKVRAQQTRKS